VVLRRNPYQYRSLDKTPGKPNQLLRVVPDLFGTDAHVEQRFASKQQFPVERRLAARIRRTEPSLLVAMANVVVAGDDQIDEFPVVDIGEGHIVEAASV
jgi:hypothetical protein